MVPFSWRGSFGSFAWLALLFLACQDSAIVQSECSNIPDLGCPVVAGDDACRDPACNALYTCKAQRWTFSQSCHHDASARVDSATDARTDAGHRDVEIDAPPGASGGPGCVALQQPDCPLATALACPSGCCECEDLFVCTNGSWEAWGTCSNGVVAQSQ